MVDFFRIQRFKDVLPGFIEITISCSVQAFKHIKQQDQLFQDLNTETFVDAVKPMGDGIGQINGIVIGYGNKIHTCRLCG